VVLGRPLPRHVVDFAGRTQVFGRLAVAVQTPLHLQRVLRVHQRHLIHAAVTGRAADALVYVNGMVEVDEIGQVVHPRPGNRLAGHPAIAHRLQQLRVRPDLRVAVHAGPRGRNPRVTRHLHRRVAVLALQPQPLHVVLVAERNGLVRTLALTRHPGRALQLVQRHPQCNHNQSRQHKARASQSIGATVKYLRHELFPARFTCRNAAAVLAVTRTMYKIGARANE
jgi:hypothetical protein